jgi:hypothetical protein
VKIAIKNIKLLFDRSVFCNSCLIENRKETVIGLIENDRTFFLGIAFYKTRIRTAITVFSRFSTMIAKL